MDVVARVLIQYLHVFAAVLWVGGGFYTIAVQLPALVATPPAARGPVMAQIVPRQIRYILRVAELTIATGLLQLFVSGRARELTAPLGSAWAIAILVGIVLALGVYGFLRGVVVPVIRRGLELGPRAQAGDAAAIAELRVLPDRVRRLGYVQLATGALIILAMVTARFS